MHLSVVGSILIYPTSMMNRLAIVAIHRLPVAVALKDLFRMHLTATASVPTDIGLRVNYLAFVGLSLRLRRRQNKSHNQSRHKCQ